MKKKKQFPSIEKRLSGKLRNAKFITKYDITLIHERPNKREPKSRTPQTIEQNGIIDIFKLGSLEHVCPDTHLSEFTESATINPMLTHDCYAYEASVECVSAFTLAMVLLSNSEREFTTVVIMPDDPHDPNENMIAPAVSKMNQMFETDICIRPISKDAETRLNNCYGSCLGVVWPNNSRVGIDGIVDSNEAHLSSLTSMQKYNADTFVWPGYGAIANSEKFPLSKNLTPPQLKNVKELHCSWKDLSKLRKARLKLRNNASAFEHTCSAILSGEYDKAIRLANQYGEPHASFISEVVAYLVEGKHDK
jgi:hypothetical protein